MTRDEDVWAPPAGGAPADPFAAYPRYPQQVIWLPEATWKARAADLTTWLERRFPDGGTAAQRHGRGRRRLWVSVLLCGLVLVALAVGLDKYGVPEPPSSARQPWLPWLFGSLLVAWAGLGAALVLATRSRPAVSRAERDVLMRLTASERRELRADLRVPASPDADHLDVVAAAWLAERGNVLMWGLQIVFALLYATVWQLHPLTPLPLLAALVLGKQAVEGVRDLLAARAWFAARHGPSRRAPHVGGRYG